MNYQEKRKIRKLSFNEKLYTIIEELSPAFAIQVVIEGEGRIEEEQLSISLLKLTYKIPALQMKLKGKSWYFDEITPNLILHNESFSNDLNSAIFKSKMSPKEGRTCEIHAFQSDSTTIVVRVLHSLMDGVGVLTMIDSWFDIINNIDIPTCHDYPKEEEFKKALNVKETNKSEGYKFKWKGLENSKDIEKSSNYTTILLDFDFRINGLIGKLAEWYVLQTASPARFLVPVNIRRHRPTFNSFANLSLPIYLNAKQNEKAQDIQAKLLFEIQKNNELASDKLEFFGKITPSSVLKFIVKKKIKSSQRKNLFPVSGFLSDLGNVNLNRLKTEHFKATNLYVLPVYVPLAPFCMLSCQHCDGTKIGLSLPQHYDLDSIRKSLIKFLHQEIVGKDKKEESTGNPLMLQLRKMWSEIMEIPEEEIDFNSTYSSLGGSSLNLLFMIDKIEKEILKMENKKFLTKVILIGGMLSISELEKIIVKIQEQ